MKSMESVKSLILPYYSQQIVVKAIFIYLTSELEIYFKLTY